MTSDPQNTIPAPPRRQAEGVDALALMDEFQAREEQRADESEGINASLHCVRAAKMSAARTAIAELIEQQKRDAQLVPVLLSYINDNLSLREKSRLTTELVSRNLSDHMQARFRALAGVNGGAA